LDSAYASEDYKSIESISAVGALNISNVLSVYAGGFAGVIKNYQARHQAETPDVAQIDDITIVANEFKVENVTRAIVGGLVGEASASAFNNVKVGVVQVGAIKVSASVFAYVGGLIGVLSDANSSDVYLKNANAFGLSLDVSAVDFLKGGLIGRLLGTSDNVILGDCKNASGETNQIGNKLVD
ncbi:MAG: hypothetical protein LBT20_01145, partial [Clostridiales bacterium]|nr:hypothetical protein [Clostridiales bacterium]